MDLNPYLTFPGNCAEAMEFYAEVFGGSIEAMMRVADSPMAAEMPAEAQDKVMHARLRVGARAIMASDALTGEAEAPRGFSVQVGFDDPDKAARVFARLAKGGEATMPFAPTFWAAGFGMCRDRFGIPWMVNCDAAPEGG